MWLSSCSGARDLVDVTSNADHVMLVGITCGLSAPYVAGQIDYAMQQVCQQFLSSTCTLKLQTHRLPVAYGGKIFMHIHSPPYHDQMLVGGWVGGCGSRERQRARGGMYMYGPCFA